MATQALDEAPLGTSRAAEERKPIVEGEVEVSIERPPGDHQPSGKDAAGGGWVLERLPRPRVSWMGGQGAFPGGWLQLDGEELKSFFSRGRTPCPQSSSSAERITKPLLWDAAKMAYSEPEEGEGFATSTHSLDRSPETLRLAEEVGSWRDQVKQKQQQQQEEGGRGGGAPEGSAADEDYFYVQIATALADKLADMEEDRKQDYASEIVALRHRGELVGVVDCYQRTKTRSLILKYALAHPCSQLPPDRRPNGTAGGVGRAALSYLVGRAQEERHRSVRMEALSLRLYLSAASLGFHQIGTTVPKLPADAFPSPPEAALSEASAAAVPAEAYS